MAKEKKEEEIKVEELSMNPEDWEAQTTFEEMDVREITEEAGGDENEAND